MGITSIFWNRKGAPAGDIFVPTGQTTGYIDLPVTLMTIGGSAPITTTSTPRLWYSSNNAPTQGWIEIYPQSTNSGDIKTDSWVTNFRLPGTYISQTDLTLCCYGLSEQANNSGPPAQALINARAYRNGPSSGKQGFGETIATVWTWNTDLVLDDPQTVAYKERILTGAQWDESSEADLIEFTIDGDNASFPLSANDLIQIVFESTIESSHASDNAWMFFMNFYVIYDKWETG